MEFILCCDHWEEMPCTYLRCLVSHFPVACFLLEEKGGGLFSRRMGIVGDNVKNLGSAGC